MSGYRAKLVRPLSTGQIMLGNIGRVAEESILRLIERLVCGVSLTRKTISLIVVSPLVLAELFVTLGLSCVQELVLWIADHMVQLSLAVKLKTLPKAVDSQYAK